MSQILNGQINLKDGMTSVLNKISKKLQTMNQGMPTIVNGIDKSLDKMTDRFKKYERDITTHQNKMMMNMRNSQQKFIKQLHSTPGEIDKVNAKMTAKSRSMSMHGQNIAMGLGSAGVVGGYAAYKGGRNFIDFDKEMADLRAKSVGEAGAMLKEQKAQAIKLGMSSRYSATEILKAKNILAKAGITGKQALDLTPNVVNLASANDLSMDDAATAMIAASKTFGLTSVPEMTKVVDMLSYTANKTNSDVMGLIKSMNYSGSTAKAFGMSLEENLFFSGKLKDFGMADSTVGTSMNQFIERILTSDKAQATMKENLGVDIYNRDDKGNPTSRKNIFDILTQMKQGLAGKNIEEQPKILKAIAETRGFRALGKLLEMDTAVMAKAREEYMDYDKIRGYASKMEAERLKSYAGQMEKIKSGFESMSIATGELITSMGLFSWVTEKANNFSDFIDKYQEYNSLMEENNNNILYVRDLLGDSVWYDTIMFFEGFVKGLHQVKDTFVEIYNEVGKFFGVLNTGGPKNLGELTAKFISYTAVLGPLGVAMLLVKNMTMGMYSAFALLTDVMKHAMNGVSFFGRLFTDADSPVSGKKGTVSGASFGNRRRKGGAAAATAGSVIADILGIDNTVGNSSSQMSTAASILGSNLTGDSEGDRLRELAKKVSQKNNSVGVASAMGASTFAGPATAGGFGGMINNKKGPASIAAGMKTLSNSALGGMDHVAYHSDGTRQGFVTGLTDASLPARSSSALGTGATGLDDDNPKKISRWSRIGGIGKGGIAGAGAIGDQYLRAITLGSDKLHGVAKAGIVGAKNKTKNIIGDIATAAFSGFEQFTGYESKKGDYNTTNKRGESVPIKGKDIRRGQTRRILNKINKPVVGLIKSPKKTLLAGGSALIGGAKAGGKSLAGAGKGLMGAGAAGVGAMLDGLISGVSMFGGMLKTVLLTALSPFSIAIASIAVIGIALFAMLKKDGESWGEMFARIVNNITETAMFLWKEVFVPFGKGLAEAFAPTIYLIQEKFKAIGEMLAPMWERIKLMFGGGEGGGGLTGTFKKLGETIGWVFQYVLTPAINMFMKALEVILGLLGDVMEIFTSLVTGNWSNLGKSILRMFVRIVTGIFGLIATFIDSIFGQLGIDSGLNKFVTENMNPDTIVNSIFGEDVESIAKLKEQVAKDKKAEEVNADWNSSNNSVQGDKTPEFEPWRGTDSWTSEQTQDDQESLNREQAMLEKMDQQNKELAAINKNTNKDCNTNLDGKKISKNQQRVNAIKRVQGQGYYTTRTSMGQGRLGPGMIAAR